MDAKAQLKLSQAVQKIKGLIVFIIRPCKETVFMELCESRGGRPGLSVLTSSILVSMDVKQH